MQTTIMQQTIIKLEKSLNEVGLEYQTLPIFNDIKLGANIYIKYDRQESDTDIIQLTIDKDLFTLTIPGFCLSLTDDYQALKACNILHAIPYEAGKFIYHPSKQAIDYVLYDFISPDIQGNIEAMAAHMKAATQMGEAYMLIKDESEKNGRLE